MKRQEFLQPVLKTVLAVLALGLVSGCASDPRFKEGIAWVQWQEAEKRQLQAAGFPQYNLD